MVVWVYWKHINDHINNKIIINKKLEFACVMVCASLRHIIQSFYFLMMMMNNDLFNTTIIMYATMLFWWPWMHRLINIIYTNDDCIVPAIDCYKKIISGFLIIFDSSTTTTTMILSFHWFIEKIGSKKKSSYCYEMAKHTYYMNDYQKKKKNRMLWYCVHIL